jgi:hypothetical protein
MIPDVSAILPCDDSVSERAGNWCHSLLAGSDCQVLCITSEYSRNVSYVEFSLRVAKALVLYFGHGNAHCWIVDGTPIVCDDEIGAARGKAVVSIACDTGIAMGPSAIRSGIKSWLGFTIPIVSLVPHRNKDPLGDAIVDALRPLLSGGSMGEAADNVRAKLAALSNEFRPEHTHGNHPAAWLGFFAAKAMSECVVLHGNPAFRPCTCR